MRTEITTRRDNQIAFAGQIADMYDVIVGFIDENVGTTTYNSPRNFTVTDSEHDMRFMINSGENFDDLNGEITLFIDDTTNGYKRLAQLSISATGELIMEDYKTMPRAKRTYIFNLVGDLLDVVDAYVAEHQSPDTSPTNNDEPNTEDDLADE